MATALPSLTATADVAGGASQAGESNFNSSPANALETIAGAEDGDYIYVNQNASGIYSTYYPLQDVPTDFSSISSLQVRLRYGWSATPTNTNWDNLYARIETSGGTILAAADAGGTYQTVVSSITTTTATNSSNVAFSYVNTGASKADWNDAWFRIGVVRTKIKGGGSQEQRIYAAEVSGVYNEAAPVTTKIYMIT